VKIPAEQRPDLWPPKLEWADYETYIFGTLQRLNPGAVVRQNVHLMGQSGRSRQIDVLVERSAENFNLKIAVDSKCYKRKVNIKHVEAFLGMLEDIGLKKGVLVTTMGYSKSAYQRAQFGSREVELHILSPERLSEFQHIGDAYPWVEPVAAVLSTPQGWVVDNEGPGRERGLFAMYQLGHTRSSAQRRGAYIYGNIILKSETKPTMESIARFHEQAVVERYPNARFERLPSPRFQNESTGKAAETILRIGRIDAGYKGPEYSLYIDHPKGALILVLLCPEGEEKKYLLILKWVGEKALLFDYIDERPMMTHEVLGRISMHWNRAKYVEVYERSQPTLPWKRTREYVEILQPIRLQSEPFQSRPSEPGGFVLESCEFITKTFPVDGEKRYEIPGEGWLIPLWDPESSVPEPKIIVHVKGLGDPAEVRGLEYLSFFTSTRLPFSSDEWPPLPGVDLRPLLLPRDLRPQDAAAP
jgi:hypothetical protein